MHAFLLVPNINYLLRSKKIANKHKAEVFPFELQKIEDVRNLRKLVRLSFFQKTAILLKDIDTATPQAQSALLKNLEEPQKNILYILTASNLNNVIETIQSRCEIIQTRSTNHKNINKTQITKFNNSKIGEKFEILGKIKDRGEAIEFIKNLIYLDHQQKKFKNQENYLQTLKNLKDNGNIALQLTNMLVKMDSHG